MTRNITLAVDEEVLERARVVAAQRKTTVNAMVRDYLKSVTGHGASEQASTVEQAHSFHERMKEALDEGRARYGDSSLFNREEIYDREYQRAQTYFENRAALLKLIDETRADMGRQRWNREALYDR